MNKILEEKLNGYSVLFRFITPILIVMVGFFLKFGINRIFDKLDLLDEHFTNHLEHHQDLEVGYERRLTYLENTKFTYQDGKNLEADIMNKLPPKWLVNDVEDLKKGLIDLKAFHERDIQEKLRRK